MNPTAQQLVEHLGLLAHPEGGYFRETFRSGAAPMASEGQTDLRGEVMPAYQERVPRNLLTSIYWMPTADSPIGWLCCNRAAHVHYYHAGASLTYHLVSPEGELTVERLGPNVLAGEVLQLSVPGGYWKAAELQTGEYCLLGEGVAPGFDFEDFQFIGEEQLRARTSDLSSLCRFIKPDRRRDFQRYYSDASAHDGEPQF